MATLNVTGLTQVCVLCGSLHFTLGSRLGRRASDIPQLLKYHSYCPLASPQWPAAACAALTHGCRERAGGAQGVKAGHIFNQR